MGRPASEEEDAVVAALCVRLQREDPGPWPVNGRQMRQTLQVLRREPWRGRAVVLEVRRRIVGYALLIAYWSNELGGEVCGIDELYVARAFRSRGHGAALFEAIERGALGSGSLVGAALGVTPGNGRARALYERLGFAAVGVSMVKRYARDSRALAARGRTRRRS